MSLELRDMDNGPGCAHCNQWAQQSRRGAAWVWRWVTILCPECDAPVCLDCCAKVHEGEIACGEAAASARGCVGETKESEI